MTGFFLPRALPRAAAVTLLFFLAGLTAAGCGLYTDIMSATRDMQLGLGRSRSDLKMKVVLRPVENRSVVAAEGYPAAFGRAFSEALAEECPAVVQIRPGEPGYPDTLLRLPEIQPGPSDNQAVAGIGRKIGANAVLSETIFDISGKTERRGILWFRDSKSFLQFNVGVAALDMETGARFLDETYEDEIEIDPFDLEIFERERRIQGKAIEEALREAAEELAETACERIQEIPWKGFLVSGGDLVQIAAGENVGVTAGDVFDVYATGKEMQGIEGQLFYLPGKKVAQVRVVSVTPDRAIAEVVASEAALAPGYTVRLAE